MFSPLRLTGTPRAEVVEHFQIMDQLKKYRAIYTPQSWL
jgi:hypothetical protein